MKTDEVVDEDFGWKAMKTYEESFDRQYM